MGNNDAKTFIGRRLMANSAEPGPTRRGEVIEEDSDRFLVRWVSGRRTWVSRSRVHSDVQIRTTGYTMFSVAP